jgi:hypothetical protein
MMTTKDYNALAAEMMGYEIFPPELEHDCIVSIADDRKIWWFPLHDRNQALMLLKRAEELGLAEDVICKVRAASPHEIDPYAPPDWKDLYWLLSCPTDTITRACVDVWEAWRAGERAKEQAQHAN